MKIPKKVRIFGHDYSVDLDDKLFVRESVGCAKACANSLEITLASNVPESRQAEGFLHEIFEMVRYAVQAEISHNDLSALSEGLFSVLRDNGLDFSNGKK